MWYSLNHRDKVLFNWKLHRKTTLTARLRYSTNTWARYDETYIEQKCLFHYFFLLLLFIRRAFFFFHSFLYFFSLVELAASVNVLNFMYPLECVHKPRMNTKIPTVIFIRPRKLPLQSFDFTYFLDCILRGKTAISLPSLYHSRLLHTSEPDSQAQSLLWRCRLHRNCFTVDRERINVTYLSEQQRMNEMNEWTNRTVPMCIHFIQWNCWFNFSWSRNCLHSLPSRDWLEFSPFCAFFQMAYCCMYITYTKYWPRCKRPP